MMPRIKNLRCTVCGYSNLPTARHCFFCAAVLTQTPLTDPAVLDSLAPAGDGRHPEGDGEQPGSRP